MTKASLCWAGLIALVACGGDGPYDSATSAPLPKGPTAASIAIADPHGAFGLIVLAVNEHTVLTATVRDATGAVLNGHAVTWTSRASNIATVDSTGLVTAVGVGDATITAACDGKSDSITVRVIAPPPPPPMGSVAIDQRLGFFDRFLLDLREQITLTATVRDASGAVLIGQHVTWTSSAPNVATVDSTGLITGTSAGDATITATSDGTSDSRGVRVIPLNLMEYHLTVVVTDTVGAPMPGVSVLEDYYGAKPADCYTCNIPWGNAVAGITNGSGSYTGSFVASPEAMNGWSGVAHTYGYIIVRTAGYETDRRFVAGTSTTFTQGVQLRALRKINAGDSLSLTIASTDPVYQALDTDPAESGGLLCRTFHVLAATDGILTVNAVPVGADGAAVYVELDSPDERESYVAGQGNATKSVHVGEVVQVRVVTFMKAGDPARAFVLHTAVR